MQTEQDLIAKIKSGDIKAFDEFYRRNWRLLYHMAYQATRSSADAKDLVQTVFINFWGIRETLSVERYHASYLTIAIKNAIANFFKKDASRRKTLEQVLTEIGKKPTPENPVEDRLIAKQTAITLDQHIHLLPEKMQQVFILSRQQYLSVNEISALLNISPQTVKNQLTNALKILRTKMEAA
ncbi:sigma-70 family RNA polymerase sigma factor [Mucilaginibacter yixingensis]|nr:sigma-70 family RNA polymerase sigma factor [Mucilaginibacter yixingensis]